MKVDYRKDIHKLFEQLRENIEIKNELQIMRLEALEQMEQSMLEENSKEALERVQRMIERRNKKIFNFPLANKRIEIKDDKILVTTLS